MDGHLNYQNKQMKHIHFKNCYTGINQTYKVIANVKFVYTTKCYNDATMITGACPSFHTGHFLSNKNQTIFFGHGINKWCMNPLWMIKSIDIHVVTMGNKESSDSIYLSQPLQHSFLCRNILLFTQDIFIKLAHTFSIIYVILMTKTICSMP